MSDINYDNYKTVEDLRWFFDNNYGPHANEMARHVIDRLERSEKQRANMLVIMERIEDVADSDIDCPFCGVIGDKDHRRSCLVNYARAAIASARGEETP